MVRFFTVLSILLTFCASSLFAQTRQIGEASYYAASLEGRKTASGEVYRGNLFTAAHRTLPFGAIVKVTNLKNGKVVTVKINDMGPNKESRIIDLSYAAAEAIDMIRDGIVQVQIDVLSEYPNDDSPFQTGPADASRPLPGSTPAAPSSSNLRAQESTNAPASDSDMVLPNLRPASPLTSTPAGANQRAASPNNAVAPTKALGLFEFYAQRVNASGYGVQVGVFGDYENVLEVTDILADRDVEAFLLKHSIENGRSAFHLIVGPFNNKGAAIEFQRVMRTIPGLGKGIILNLATL